MERYQTRLGALAFYIDCELKVVDQMAVAARQCGDFVQGKKLENVRFALAEAASLLRDAREGV